MATVPTPTIQTAGTAVPAATINSQGNLATFLAGRAESGGALRALALVRQTVVQSLTTAVNTALTFDVEDVDYDNGHSTVTNTSRYTASTVGWYQISACVTFAANATGQRVIQLAKNLSSLQGTAVEVNASAANVTSIATPTFFVFLAATDFVEAYVMQNSGGALNTAVAGTLGQASCMSVRWVHV